MEVRGIFQGSFGGSLIKFKRKPEEESVKDIKDIAGTLISPRKKNGTSKHTHESESARERSLSIESPRRVLKNTKNWKSEETLWVQQLTPLKMAEKFYNSKKHGGVVLVQGIIRWARIRDHRHKLSIIEGMNFDLYRLMKPYIKVLEVINRFFFELQKEAERHQYFPGSILWGGLNEKGVAMLLEEKLRGPSVSSIYRLKEFIEAKELIEKNKMMRSIFVAAMGGQKVMDVISSILVETQVRRDRAKTYPAFLVPIIQFQKIEISVKKILELPKVQITIRKEVDTEPAKFRSIKRKKNEIEEKYFFRLLSRINDKGFDSFEKKVVLEQVGGLLEICNVSSLENDETDIIGSDLYDLTTSSRSQSDNRIVDFCEKELGTSVKEKNEDSDSSSEKFQESTCFMHIYLLKKITKPVVTWISELFKENVLELNGSNIKLRRVKFRTFAEIIVAGHHDAMVTLRKQYRFVLVNKSSEVVKKIPIARIWLQLSFFRTEIELKVTDFAEVSQFLPCNKPYKRSIREAQKQIKSMIMKEKFLAEI